MSNSKKQSRDARIRNYSFSNNQSSNLTPSEYDQHNREPLRETDIIRNYSPSRFQSDSLLKMPAYSLPPEPSPEALYALQQEDEIRKLEEVIYYLTGDKDILKQECASLQIQLSTITTNFGKQKDSYEAEIRKLKEIIKDKESECQSIAKGSRKDQEIFQQENERMRLQLKLLIEKKNDEIYSITREKQTQNQQIRRSLEAIIEELKSTHKKQLSEKDSTYEALQDQINLGKEKNRSLEEEIASCNQRFESQKLRLIEDNEIFLSDLKENYHQTKMQIVQASKEEVQALEKCSEIQRQAFLIEINTQRNLNAIHEKENQELHNLLFQSNRQHEDDVHGFLSLIKQLQAKLSHIHQQKQKEIQFLKVKVAHLHTLDLKAAEDIYTTRVARLAEHSRAIQAQNKILKQILEDERNKNKNLAFELANRTSLLHQQIATLKFNHNRVCEDLNTKFQKEKNNIIQHSNQAIKQKETKESKITFQEEELKKLRKLFDNKSKQMDELEKEVNKIKNEISSQKQKNEGQVNALKRQWNEERQKLKHESSFRQKQVQRLSNLLIEKANDDSKYDYSHLENEIKDIKAKLKARTDEGKSWREKADTLKEKIEDLLNQKERLKNQIEKDSSENQAHWEEKSRQRVKDIQSFYQRKIESLLLEKQQLKNENDEQASKLSELARKYSELDCTLKDLLNSANKRSGLESKIILLGLDTNLVKNKQQLFEY